MNYDLCLSHRLVYLGNWMQRQSLDLVYPFYMRSVTMRVKR